MQNDGNARAVGSSARVYPMTRPDQIYCGARNVNGGNRLTTEMDHDCIAYQVTIRGRNVCRKCGLENPAGDRVEFEVPLIQDMRNGSSRSSTLTSFPGTGLTNHSWIPVHTTQWRMVVNEDERTRLRALELCSTVSLLLTLPRQTFTRMVYVTRKILNHKAIYKANTTLATAAGLYIALRENDVKFKVSTLVDMLSSMNHTVTISNMLKTVSLFASVVGYDRNRQSGAGIYFKRLATSVEFRSTFLARGYSVSFTEFMGRAKATYKKAKAAHVAKHGHVNGGHAIIVCRAVAATERELVADKPMVSGQKRRAFTIPYLLSIVGSNEMLVVG